MMKKLATIVLLVFMVKANAQLSLFVKIKNQLKIEHPEISLENKLIAVNVWTSADKNSCDANKQFNKAFNIYEFAKLKGGVKGIICVTINKLNETATIILMKDSANKLIQINNINLNDISNVTNSVFDAQGNEVYKNLATDKIFESINKLITR